jgi:uncharacterized protein YtpQ (UPF0354 family)
MTEVNKKLVTKNEFDKKVEIEISNLVYFDRMKKEKAIEKAIQYVGSKYQVL